jgi:hypothetical protein
VHEFASLKSYEQICPGVLYPLWWSSGNGLGCTYSAAQRLTLPALTKVNLLILLLVGSVQLFPGDDCFVYGRTCFRCTNIWRSVLLDLQIPFQEI